MSSIIVSRDGNTIEQIIEKDGIYPSVTVGRSMRPLFKTHRDMVILEKCSEPPKKYDVVLYRIGEKYILHRIIGIDSEKNCYIIRGDNTYKKEYVPFSKIIARLTSFKRRGKHGSVEDSSYKIYSRVWNFIYPIRFLFNLFKRCIKKVYRSIFRSSKNNSVNN